MMKYFKSLGLFAPMLLGICLFAVSCGKKAESTAVTGTTVPTGAKAASAAVVRLEFAKLVGKWQRPDGGYVIEIKGVDAAGTLDAAYFNPNPINVSHAAALYKDGTTKVFVELRAPNYPGSTYTLTYDPQTDQLYGQYYQAAMQHTFEVTFARMK